MSNPIAADILMHYGVKRRSGRYPYGSGDNPYQHEAFYKRYNRYKAQGLSETEIAKKMKITTTQLRVLKSMARSSKREALVDTAEALRDKGHSPTEIARIMGYKNESSVRSLLNPRAKERMNVAMTTADFLKEVVDDKKMIDVGKGVERELGVSKEKLREAITILELQGYEYYGGGIPQMTNRGRQTNQAVLCVPGTQHKDIFDPNNVHSVREYHKVLSEDGTVIRKKFEYPSSLDSKRIMVSYAEDGGKEKDGVVEIRRGVQDLSLGDSHYAQVRILVDGTHYIKGMAVYADDLPDGVDVRFNTNKSNSTPLIGPKDNSVLKPITSDPRNPFGSLIKDADQGGQSYYDDPNGNYIHPVTGNKQSLSLINKRADEGDWGSWADKLPSQFLAKQNKSLVDRQLKMSLDDKTAELESITILNNPTVKKRLLRSFADDCDAASVHLKAAALPRQKYQVILPLTTIKPTEVYAPNYENGEQVALVRFPHGGTFEIPILTVNNKVKEGERVLSKTPKDAIGISAEVAERLSGADFDGDTVMVIPTGAKGIKITSRPELKGTKGFDPKLEYGGRPEGSFKPMKNTQTEMGIISNLITDMTLLGATDDELARAVRHSMVVIDAEKHGLDYKASERDNGIAALHRKYQGHYDEDGKYREGASTLISRAKSQQPVTKRQGSPKVNMPGKPWYDPNRPEGALVYTTAENATYVNKKGKTVTRTQKSTKMAETDDAFTLVSEADTAVERAYATYANSLKAMANQARKEMMTTGKIEYNAQANKTYAKEVETLKDQLRVAERNAPRERSAQRIANARMLEYEETFPDMKEAEKKKKRQQLLTEARLEVGAERHPISITDRQWEAIQAGAVSEHVLESILQYTDIDHVKEMATPRTGRELTPAKVSRIRSMSSLGYTQEQIAKALGVSTTTINKYL